MSTPRDRQGVNTDNTLINALIGAIATFLLSFTGISPVLGGALAAYLEGGETRDGLRVGALSGVIASLPLALVVLLGFALFPVSGDVGVAIGGIALLVVVVALIAGYVVALSALGGVIGVYVKNEL
jgi:hypothetical protein